MLEADDGKVDYDGDDENYDSGDDGDNDDAIYAFRSLSFTDLHHK